MIATLRRLACEGKRTLIAAIHQPSSEVFTLFDALLLLSGGRTVYFGDREMANEVLINKKADSFLRFLLIYYT